MRLLSFFILLFPLMAWSQQSDFDLLHADIHINPSFSEAALTGEVTHHFATRASSSDLELGARGLLVKSVVADNGKTLTYRTSAADNTLTVYSPPGGWADTFTVRIAYEALPDSQRLDYDHLKTGLHHVDLGSIRHPLQIWTQGETDFTSGWVPVPRSPGERCTQTTHITVPDGQQAFANGEPTDTVTHADRTITYTWTLRQPHAPYLFAFLTGEGLQLTRQFINQREYWVISDPTEHARALDYFSRTGEMMDWIEQRLGVSYPWGNNYKQGMVRGFESGAMENTTMVLFNNAFIHDYPNTFMDRDFGDYVIFHEMFHQWFGNLVTCAEWGQLAMNEGFATYGEYLWLEYTRGKDEADAYKHEVFFHDYYLNEVKEDTLPIIRSEVANPEELFNSLRYDKPAMVLHLLRYELGDDFFWEVLKRYLDANAFTEVTLDDFASSILQVTGKDHNWFLEQWFHRSGHPKLDVEITPRNVTIKQVQKGKYYNLPIVLEAWFPNGKRVRHSTRINEISTSFMLPSSFSGASYITFDPDAALLAQVSIVKPKAQWVAQLHDADSYSATNKAIEWANDTLAYWHQSQSRDEVIEAIRSLLSHTNWSIRLAAGKSLIAHELPHVVPPAVLHALSNDSKAAVCIGLMTELEKKLLGIDAQVALTEILYTIVSTTPKSTDTRVVAQAIKLLAIVGHTGKESEQRLLATVEHLIAQELDSEILTWRCAEVLLQSRHYDKALTLIEALPDNRNFTSHIEALVGIYSLPGLPYMVQREIVDFLLEKARFGHNHRIKDTAIKGLCKLAGTFPNLNDEVNKLLKEPSLRAYHDSIVVWRLSISADPVIPVRVVLPEHMEIYPAGLAFVVVTDPTMTIEMLDVLSWYERGSIPPFQVMPVRFADGEAFVMVAPESITGLSADSSSLEIAKISASQLTGGKHYLMAVGLNRLTNVGLDLTLAGNIYTNPVHISPTGITEIILDQQSKEPPLLSINNNIHSEEIPSPLITAFVGQKFNHQIAVVMPENYSQKKQYEILYDFGGYGGGLNRAQVFVTNDSLRDFYANNTDLIIVHLSPAATYGDNYWVNSAVNGPFLNSLIQELIPVVEEKYCTNGPKNRYLRGGSTGGWVALNVFLRNPTLFNSVVSYSPDPLSLNAFQEIDLYKGQAFRSASGLIPSARKDTGHSGTDTTKYTVWEEFGHERLLGGGDVLRSGMQWSGWFNAYGPAKFGKGIPLWNNEGEIDNRTLNFWQQSELTSYVMERWDVLGPRFRNGDVTVYVGSHDTYFLNLGVQQFHQALESKEGSPLNFVHIGEGANHSYLRRNKLTYFRTTLEQLRKK